MPGGIGTLDELFEAWSWNALGYHAKPFALLNVDGFWDGMIGFLDHVMASGFMSPARRAQLLVADDIGEVIDRLDAAIGAAEAENGLVMPRQTMVRQTDDAGGSHEYLIGIGRHHR